MTHYAAITPTHKGDYWRCHLLCNSIDLYAVTPFHHYLVVDQRDFDLFKKFRSKHRDVLVTEDILKGVKRLPLVKNGWMSIKPPMLVRNWIVQQAIKLSANLFASEDVYIFIDSDCFFLKSFSVETLEQNRQIGLFREADTIRDPGNPIAKWVTSSADLLNIVHPGYPQSNYLGNYVSWTKSNLKSLQDYIELVNCEPFLHTILKSRNLSEYMLYGMYVEHVLGQRLSKHFYRGKITHTYWSNKLMSKLDIRNFFESVPDHCFLGMISSKSGTDPFDYKKFVIDQVFKESLIRV